MPNLRSVVNAILADITLAQHRANRLARKLARDYYSDAILQHLPVPRATIDEMELTLHFAVQSVGAAREEPPATLASQANQPPADAAPSPSAVSRAAAEIAGAVADGLADAVRSAASGDDGLRGRLLASLAPGPVRDSLADQVAAALRDWWNRWSAENEPRAGVAADEPPVDSALRAVAERLAAALGDDGELRGLLGDVQAAISGAVEKRRSEAEAALKRWILRSDHGEDEHSGIPSLDVILDGKTLANLPEQAVQKATFRINLRGYRTVPAGDDHHLIPEER